MGCERSRGQGEGPGGGPRGSTAASCGLPPLPAGLGFVCGRRLSLSDLDAPPGSKLLEGSLLPKQSQSQSTKQRQVTEACWLSELSVTQKALTLCLLSQGVCVAGMTLSLDAGSGNVNNARAQVCKSSAKVHKLQWCVRWGTHRAENVGWPSSWASPCPGPDAGVTLGG